MAPWTPTSGEGNPLPNLPRRRRFAPPVIPFFGHPKSLLQSLFTSCNISDDRWSRMQQLTTKSSDGCSLSAPQHPTKPTTKATPPTAMKMMAAYDTRGSELLMSTTVWKLMIVGWSFTATPPPISAAPHSCIHSTLCRTPSERINERTNWRVHKHQGRQSRFYETAGSLRLEPTQKRTTTKNYSCTGQINSFFVIVWC